jgi:hypothetical protein
MTDKEGPLRLVQYFLYRRSSHRRNGAARHLIGMVWLYRSPIPVERRRVFNILLVQIISTCLSSARVMGGDSESYACLSDHFTPHSMSNICFILIAQSLVFQPVIR